VQVGVFGPQAAGGGLALAQQLPRLARIALPGCGQRRGQQQAAPQARCALEASWRPSSPAAADSATFLGLDQPAGREEGVGEPVGAGRQQERIADQACRLDRTVGGDQRELVVHEPWQHRGGGVVGVRRRGQRVGLVVAGQLPAGELRVDQQPWQQPAKLDVASALTQPPGTSHPATQRIDAELPANSSIEQERCGAQERPPNRRDDLSLGPGRRWMPSGLRRRRRRREAFDHRSGPKDGSTCEQLPTLHVLIRRHRCFADSPGARLGYPGGSARLRRRTAPSGAYQSPC
jgi:hypothetical protein